MALELLLFLPFGTIAGKGSPRSVCFLFHEAAEEREKREREQGVYFPPGGDGEYPYL